MQQTFLKLQLLKAALSSAPRAARRAGVTGEVAKPKVLTEGERMKTYNKANIPLAKELRKNMTPWERKLWYEFLRGYPLRFQRQKAIGNYIADFYCAKAKLVLELDGGVHYTEIQAEQDAARTIELEKMNLTVLRICNRDIDCNFSGVCEYIDAVVKNLSFSQLR